MDNQESHPVNPCPHNPNGHVDLSIYSVRDIAKMLGVSEEYTKRLARAHVLPGRRRRAKHGFGVRWIFLGSEMLTWMKQTWPLQAEFEADPDRWPRIKEGLAWHRRSGTAAARQRELAASKRQGDKSGLSRDPADSSSTVTNKSPSAITSVPGSTLDEPGG